jgi:hypothetical protein
LGPPTRSPGTSGTGRPGWRRGRGRPGGALDLLERSIEAGATLLTIGPLTNLALLEVARPGALARVPVVAMGGWTQPPAEGLPPWGPDMDFNMQFDPLAAQVVTAAAADLTLATLPATLKAHLRAADLPRLRVSGPLGELLARQGESHGADHGMGDLGRAHPGLPDDLLNFQYDPVAGAVAAGGPGAVLQHQRLQPVLDGALLRFPPAEDGRPVRVLVDLDADAWLTAVEAAQRGPAGS